MRRVCVLFLLGAVLATGCSTGKPSPTRATGAPATPAAPTTIKLGTLPGAGGTQDLDAVIAAFQDQYPEYRVETVPLPASVMGVYEAMVHGDVDLVPGNNMYLAKALRDGAMADLSPYVRSPGISTDAIDWFLDAQFDKSTILELPYAAVPTAVVYNHDMASAAGVTIPQAGWTWDQFREIARRLTKQEGENRTYGFVGDNLSLPVSLWVKQAGGPPLSRPSSESVSDALRYFSGALFADRFMVNPQHVSQHVDRPEDLKPEEFAKPEDLFATGRAAMAIRPIPETRGAQTLPFEWGIAPIPNVPGARPVLFVMARSLAMSSHAPNREGAWQFLKFLTGRDGAMVLAAAGTLPCYPAEEAKLLWIQSRPGLPQSVRSLLDAQWITMYWLTESTSRDGLLAGATRKALENGSSWESAAAEYAKAAQKAGFQ